jgi:hypothetical protein
MADEKRSNLEPIDESDLDFKEKLFGGAREEKSDSADNPEVKLEKPPILEQGQERKEGVVEREAAYAKILSQAPSPISSGSDEEVKSDSEAMEKTNDYESKIKTLVNLAEMKGLPHAVKVARHYEDNYLLDEFHDRMLSQELHDALVKKGLIKEI